MFETIIDKIDYATAHLSWHGLVGMAIACTPSGLIIWLCGLGMARVAAASIGGFAGCFVVYAFISISTFSLVIGAAVGVAAGIALETALAASVGCATITYRVAFATVSACAGTFLVFVGIIFLISLKSAKVTEHINEHELLYAAAAFAMILFGAVEQLLFIKHKRRVVPESGVRCPEINVEPSHKALWRTR